MAGFVKFEVPKELVDTIYEAVALASRSGKLRKGVNESTKAIERGIAKLVIMAQDVSPEEILMHIPMICDEKKTPYVYVPAKLDLGKASGINVPTSAITIVEAGEGKKQLDEIVKKLETLKK